MLREIVTAKKHFTRYRCPYFCRYVQYAKKKRVNVRERFIYSLVVLVSCQKHFTCFMEIEKKLHVFASEKTEVSHTQVLEYATDENLSIDIQDIRGSLWVDV